MYLRDQQKQYMKRKKKKKQNEERKNDKEGKREGQEGGKQRGREKEQEGGRKEELKTKKEYKAYFKMDQYLYNWNSNCKLWQKILWPYLKYWIISKIFKNVKIDEKYL